MTKGPIHQAQGRIKNLYVHNNKASKSMKNIDRNIRRNRQTRIHSERLW